MSVEIRSASGSTLPERFRVVTEVNEELNGLDGQTTVTSVALTVRLGRQSPDVSSFYNTAIGTIGSVALGPSNHRREHEITSGTAQNGLRTTLVHVPIYAPYPFRNPAQGTRRYRRYLYTQPIRIPTRGTAIVAVGLSAGGIVSTGSTVRGYEIASDPATNAGRWTVRSNLTGSLAIGADSGVTPSTSDAFDVLAIEYTDGPTPRLRFFANGVVFSVLTGAASLPQLTSAGAATNPFVAVLTPAGTTVRRGDARLVIVELG